MRILFHLFCCRKISKKRILRELTEALEKNNTLREQVARLTDEGSGASLSSVREDSLMLSTMNNWTLGTLNIPECVPTSGETDIDKQAFEYWKDILVSSLQLFNAVDEQTKFGVFKIKSGPKLRETFQATSSGPGMPDEKTHPFSNAMARLNAYYGSRAYTLSQRGKLMMMSPMDMESSINFVRRVGTAAKLCNYGPDEEMEAVVRVIAKNANDARVRVLAHRNWVKQGSMQDLIDLVRDHEIEKSNEEEFQRSRNPSQSMKVSALSQDRSEFQGHRESFNSNRHTRGYHRGNHRNGRAGYGIVRGNSHQQGPSNCWRCGSAFHRASACFAINKDCRACGRLGHIARACTSNGSANQPRNQNRGLKRSADQEDSGVERKIAAIEDTKTELFDTKVCETEDLE